MDKATDALNFHHKRRRNRRVERRGGRGPWEPSAHSGTGEFLEALQSREVKDNPGLWGGFESVCTPLSWWSKPRYGFSLQEEPVNGDGADPIGGCRRQHIYSGRYGGASKGTDVILHLKEEGKEYLETWEIRNIVREILSISSSTRL